MAIGDHLVVSFGLYQHHAIDLGDGRVIQYGGGELSALNHRVFIEPLGALAEKGDVVTLDLPASFPAEQIIQRAKSRIGEKNYSLFGNNCEHFVNWCRTGHAVSHQANRLVGRTASCLVKLAKRPLVAKLSQMLGSSASHRIKSSATPWLLLADAVQLGVESVATHRGVTGERAQRLAAATGLGASVGIGVVTGGPIGGLIGAKVWAMGETAAMAARKTGSSTTASR